MVNAEQAREKTAQAVARNDALYKGFCKNALAYVLRAISNAAEQGNYNLRVNLSSFCGILGADKLPLIYHTRAIREVSDTLNSPRYGYRASVFTGSFDTYLEVIW